MRRTVLAVAAVACFAAVSYADIRLPDPKPTPKTKTEKLIDTQMSIRLDRDANEAKLLIPRSQLKQLRAELEQLDGGFENSAAGITRTQTIVSGIFISLAIAFGGIWFARSGRAASRMVKAAVITMGITILGTAATFVYANAGPPAEARSITGKMFSASVHMYNFGSGHVKLGVADDDDGLLLIVPNPTEKPSGE